MKALIIDDDSIVTEAIKDAMESFVPGRKYGRNFDIDAAQNFFEARDCLEKPGSAYNLIISDLLLPIKGADVPDSCTDKALSGWFFLYYHLLKDDGRYHNKCKDAVIIIYSAYASVWEHYIKDNNLENYKDRVIVIPKGHIYDNTGSYKAIVETIKGMFADGGQK